MKPVPYISCHFLIDTFSPFVFQLVHSSTGIWQGPCQLPWVGAQPIMEDRKWATYEQLHFRSGRTRIAMRHTSSQSQTSSSAPDLLRVEGMPVRAIQVPSLTSLHLWFIMVDIQCLPNILQEIGKVNLGFNELDHNKHLVKTNKLIFLVGLG